LLDQSVRDSDPNRAQNGTEITKLSALENQVWRHQISLRLNADSVINANLDAIVIQAVTPYFNDVLAESQGKSATFEKFIRDPDT
jgi:hypothetical protein